MLNNTEETEVELKLGQEYLLRNGLKTGPLRYSNNGTMYIFEADIPQEDGVIYIFAFKKNGKYLSDNINNRFDIVEKLKNK